MQLRDSLRNSTFLLAPPHHGWFSRNKRFTLWVLAIAIIVPLLGLLVLFLPAIVDLLAGGGAVHRFIQEVGWPAPVVVGVIYTLLSVLLIPIPVLALAVAVFCSKLWVAVVVGYTATLAGACISFFLGRHKLRSSVLERFAETEAFLEIDAIVSSGQEKTWVVILLRLGPIMSCCRLNYALALTLVSFPQYIIGSVVGLFPHTVLFVFISWVSVHAFTSTDIHTLFKNLYINGTSALVALGVVVVMASLARNALVSALHHPAHGDSITQPINDDVYIVDDSDAPESSESEDSFAAEESKLRNSYQMTRSR